MTMKLVAAAACGLLLSNFAQAGEVKVLASGAIKEAALELFPQFEKSSGHTVAVTWAGTVDIKKKIAAGEVFDLVIIASPEIDAFTKDGKIAAGTKVDLVKSSVGVAGPCDRLGACKKLRDIRRPATGAGLDSSELETSFVTNQDSGNRQRIR